VHSQESSANPSIASQKQQSAEWPNYFPLGVPPDDAVDANGPVYRLVKLCPPQANDFLSSYEEYPGRSFHDLENACGMSVYRLIQDVQRTRNRYRPLRNRRIAIGVLLPEFGRMKPTPTNGDSHYTVWLRCSANLGPAFQCVEEGAA
jgi:hypothetical protein